MNAYGPLVLFQAVLPLLKESSNAKFAAIGTPLGSISGMESRPFPLAAYGMSKVMLHWFVRKVHFDHPEITAFVLDPGFVQTDMGNEGARNFGMEKAWITIEDSTNYLVSVVSILPRILQFKLLTLRRSMVLRKRKLRDTFRRLKEGTSSGSWYRSVV